MTRLVFAVVDGRPRASAKQGPRQFRETAGLIVPPLVLLALSLWLGLATPSVLRDSWTAAANQVFPGP
jgi:hydrogenase-4 component F